ncbi:unnamed protein product [Caenorhabditis angaria]|uniref:Nuclear receptor domain-containing protein n=1 Tax=Caenorhabditis angaria TaxID=860376 RepID=A0A9P1J2Z6_9PELO|nr:unnamed protein product [Caenorhabditis angaria]
MYLGSYNCKGKLLEPLPDLSTIMNDNKMPTATNWPNLPPFLSYEEQQRQQAEQQIQQVQQIQQIQQQNPFDVDMNTIRTNAPQMMPNFLPRFGFQLPEFDYRMNEFSRAGLFGACSLSGQFPTHQLAQTFNLGTNNTIAENLQIPPPPLLANQSTVIQRVPVATPPNVEKPPILSAEYQPEKVDEEMNGFDMTKHSQQFPSEVDKMAQKLHIEKMDARMREDLLFNTQFYPTAMPLDMTSTGFLKQEINIPLMDPSLDYAHIHPLMIKKDLSPLQDCMVCQSTHANGLHFGARTCAACAAFFRRTISDEKRYVCKRNQRCHNASRDGTGYRKICRSCRMKRCLEVGMLSENVQHKRTRREPTPQRKMHFDNIFHPGFYQHIQPRQ